MRTIPRQDYLLHLLCKLYTILNCNSKSFPLLQWIERTHWTSAILLANLVKWTWWELVLDGSQRDSTEVAGGIAKEEKYFPVYLVLLYYGRYFILLFRGWYLVWCKQYFTDGFWRRINVNDIHWRFWVVEERLRRSVEDKEVLLSIEYNDVSWTSRCICIVYMKWWLFALYRFKYKLNLKVKAISTETVSFVKAGQTSSSF